MITQKEDESRLEYLVRVLYSFMHTTNAGYCTIDYDETTCDGLCLADDFVAELGIVLNADD